MEFHLNTGLIYLDGGGSPRYACVVSISIFIFKSILLYPCGNTQRIILDPPDRPLPIAPDDHHGRPLVRRTKSYSKFHSRDSSTDPENIAKLQMFTIMFPSRTNSFLSRAKLLSRRRSIHLHVRVPPPVVLWLGSDKERLFGRSDALIASPSLTITCQLDIMRKIPTCPLVFQPELKIHYPVAQGLTLWIRLTGSQATNLTLKSPKRRRSNSSYRCYHPGQELLNYVQRQDYFVFLCV